MVRARNTRSAARFAGLNCSAKLPSSSCNRDKKAAHEWRFPCRSDDPPRFVRRPEPPTRVGQETLNSDWISTDSVKRIPLEQSSSRVMLEQLRIADITPQGVHRLMARYVHHLE